MGHHSHLALCWSMLLSSTCLTWQPVGCVVSGRSLPLSGPLLPSAFLMMRRGMKPEAGDKGVECPHLVSPRSSLLWPADNCPLRREAATGQKTQPGLRWPGLAREVCQWTGHAHPDLQRCVEQRLCPGLAVNPGGCVDAQLNVCSLPACSLLPILWSGSLLLTTQGFASPECFGWRDAGRGCGAEEGWWWEGCSVGCRAA